MGARSRTESGVTQARYDTLNSVLSDRPVSERLPARTSCEASSHAIGAPSPFRIAFVAGPSQTRISPRPDGAGRAYCVEQPHEIITVHHRKPRRHPHRVG